MDGILQFLGELFLGQALWIQIVVVLGGSLVVAWLADRAISFAIRRWARRTSSRIDDEILARLHGPITKSVVLLGVGMATRLLGLEEGPERVTQSALWTLGVLIWTVFAFRLCRILILSASRQDDRYKLIEHRTFPLFDNLAKVLIVAVSSYAIILIWDVDATGWMTSAGIIGVAIGFAAKDTLSNLFAGVFIMADAPYQVGDYIVLGDGQRGRVVQIGLRSTRILTRDDVEITVPNAVMGSGMITNETSTRAQVTPTRVRVSVSVAYGSDVDQVRAELVQIARENPTILDDPEPRARFRSFGDSGLAFQLMGWIPDPALRGRTLDALNTSVYKRFNEAGIKIPYPQRDVYVHGSAGDQMAGP